MQTFNWADITSILNNPSIFSYFSKGCGISVGSFDGLHKGHRVLLNTLVSGSKDLGIPSGVVTFTRPLPSIKNQNDYKGDISTLEQRLKLLESVGVDFVIIVDFNDDFAAMTGNQFFDILIQNCNMKYLCEGVDFRCGYKGSFDKYAIANYCADNQIQLSFTNPVYYEIHGRQERISSSIIRQLISDNELDLVSALLDRKYVKN